MTWDSVASFLFFNDSSMSVLFLALLFLVLLPALRDEWGLHLGQLNLGRWERKPRGLGASPLHCYSHAEL